MDFYFGEKSHSARFVDFLEGVVPTKASRLVPKTRTACVVFRFVSGSVVAWRSRSMTGVDRPCYCDVLSPVAPFICPKLDNRA